ncbi:ATP-binding protein [Tateyamaria sp. Alg231-49]|uniref:ATP-binding protein n=1 Tax=Tateyamaria sp. Alg231-49 TaxID=1922219 RepID=UPI00131F0D1A|nr:ATP-binding protein [Tateyamaria sp. Alg231-49]
MFFGVHFLFGSVFVWLGLATLGPFWAITAAFIGALHTIELWGHSYAVPILTLEAIFVCTISRWGWADRLSIWVLAYWILLGGPLGFFLLYQLMDFSSETALLITSKQVLNGLLNALLAALIVNLSLYFFPKLRIKKEIKDRASYSGLLHAIFGVLLIFPFLSSEIYDLRNSFKQNLESIIADAEGRIGPVSSNLKTFLELETSHWGVLLSNIELVENNPEIQNFIAKDKSAAPSQIYAVLNDGSRILLYGSDSPIIWSEDENYNFKNNNKSVKGQLLGCLLGNITTLKYLPRNKTTLVFTWSPEKIIHNVDVSFSPENNLRCLPRNNLNLKDNSKNTSVELIRDLSISNNTLRSWLTASVVARINLDYVSPAVLETTRSLKPMVLQIQKETAIMVERLCLLLILIIIGGQILDFLFLQWMEKFSRISEAYIKFRTPPSTYLNLNFQEDRKIVNWLDQFAKVAENAEEDSWLAQQNLKMLLVRASTPVFGTDPEGRIKAWNPALEALSGYGQDEVLGKQLEDFLEAGTETQVALDGQPATDLLIDLRTKAGKSVHLVVSQLHINPSDVTGGQNIGDGNFGIPPIFYFVAQNLNELKVSQAKLIHASRLAALGEMASSFAHEINQPLNVIALSAGSILERAKAGSVPREYLISKAERIEGQALRAGKVIQGIRNYVLEIGDEDLVVFDPVKRFVAAQDLISEQLRLDSVCVHLETPSDPIRIKGRPIMFEQAIVNLLMNSRNAMKENNGSERKINVHFIVKGGDLKILVRDTGPGIPKKNLAQIFDPFFSTNKKNGGSGIGLFMTQTIVNELNGSIKALDVSSGACIEITFPTSSVQTAS